MLTLTRTAIFSAVLAVLTGCSSAFNLDAAQRLENQNDYEGALKQYTDLAKEKPNLVEAFTGKARCLQKLDRAKEAEDALREAVHVGPTNVSAKVDLGNILENRKNLVEAKIQFDEAYLVDSKSVPVIEGQAKVMEDNGDSKGALDKYKEAIAIDPSNIDLHEKLAHTYGILNDFENAKKELAEVDKIKLQPKPKS